MLRESVHPLVWLLPCAALLAASPQNASGQTPTSGDEADFDLPAQPLNTALAAFASTTHINIAFASALVAQLRSAPVHGRFTPPEALNRLLKGTGVTAAFTDPHSAVVYREGSVLSASAQLGTAVTLDLDLAEVRAPAPIQIGHPDPRAGIDYARRAQEEIYGILANHSAYRGNALNLRVGIKTDAVGQITEVRIGRGSDEFRRDRTLPALLIGHRLANAPPPELVQPMWFDIIVDLPKKVRAQ